MRADEAIAILNKAAAVAAGSEDFLVGTLVSATRKLATSFPTDQTVTGMRAFFERKLDKEAFVTRAEIKKAYANLYTRDNKFIQYMGEHLGLDSQTSSVKYAEKIEEKPDFMGTVYSTAVSDTLKNKLASLIEKDPSKLVSDKAKKSAEHSCAHELNTIGVIPREINTVACQEDLVICQASYETPRGTTNVLIPVEIRGDKALLPTMFLATAGFMDLDKSGLESFIVSTAGKTLTVRADEILSLLDRVKNGERRVVSEIEEMAIRASLKDGNVTPSMSGVAYFEVKKEASRPLEIRVPLPEPMQSLGEKLNSVAGGAEFSFGKENIDRARGFLVKSMASFGFPHAQIRVASTTENKVFFAVAMDDGIAFKVPVKITRAGMEKPAVLLCNAEIHEFSERGIGNLLITASPDRKTAAVASRFHDTDANQLFEMCKSALAKKDYEAAEDIMTVLAESDFDLCKSAFDLFKSSVKNGGLTVTASHSGCKAQLMTKSHKLPVCGHLNVTVDKVFQDESGDCQPMYRKNMESTAQVALWTGRMLG